MYFFIFELIVIIIFLIKKEKIIIDLPIIILLSEIVLPWIMKGNLEYSAQHIRVIYSSLIFSSAIFIRTFQFKIKAIRPFIFISFGLFIIMLLNSTIFFESFKKYLHISTALLAFPAYYSYFQKNPQDITKFIGRMILFNSIALVSIVFSSVLRIGIPWGYGVNKSIYIVGINVWEMYGLIYSQILCLFLVAHFKLIKYNIANIIMTIILGLILLLIFKRMILLTYLIGIFLYLNTIVKANKKSIFTLYFVIVIIVLILPYFSDKIMIAAHSRERIYDIDNYTQEGRYFEFYDYFTKWLPSQSFKTIMIGVDFFYSGRTESFNAIASISRGRILHSDLSNFLFTTGIVGTLMFLYYLLRYLKLLFRVRGYSIYAKRLYQFMLITILLNLFSEGVDMTLNYLNFFAITGAFAGYLYEPHSTIK